jgi:transmembrane sensor
MSDTTPGGEGNQARIDAEAAAWLVRHGDGALTSKERVAFEAWLAADPTQARTFAAMSRTWRDASKLKHLANVVQPERAGWIRRVLRAMGLSQSAFRSAALAGAGAAVLAFVSFHMAGIFDGHETRVGQTRALTLADGSTVVLGAKSRIVVSFTASERRVRLTAGEALFQVRHNPARPFVVDAGDTVIRDVGTSFDVNRTGATVRVSVLEGEVEVRDHQGSLLQPEKSVHLLRAGHSLEAFRGRAEDPPQPIARLAATAWRDGQLVYENARLSDVIADVNRYYGPGVTLDPGSSELRVTASFRTNEIPAFLNTLDSALPVRVKQGYGGHFDVSQR